MCLGMLLSMPFHALTLDLSSLTFPYVGSTRSQAWSATWDHSRLFCPSGFHHVAADRIGPLNRVKGYELTVSVNSRVWYWVSSGEHAVTEL